MVVAKDEDMLAEFQLHLDDYREDVEHLIEELEREAFAAHEMRSTLALENHLMAYQQSLQAAGAVHVIMYDGVNYPG